jgi:hypothetical protein
MSFIDWFFQEDSIIWTGKGKRKTEDSKYTEELSKYCYLQNNQKPPTL